MKHIFNAGYLDKHLKEILEIGEKYFKSEEGLGFLKAILIYLYSTVEFETGKIVSIVDRISKEGGELAMTTAMRLKKEGKIEDAKKMLKKGYSVEEICDITGLEREEVEILKTQG